MISKLIPVLFLIVGTGAGIGAAVVLGQGEPTPSEHASKEVGPAELHNPHDGARGNVEYVKLANQFVVPIMQHEAVGALIVLSLSLETTPGTSEAVFAREPKLRDGFLRVLFDHANMGGFDGAFTRAENMDILRDALRQVARAELGPSILDVLIVDIARQDL